MLELVISLLIVGILAAIAIPRFFTVNDSAGVAATVADIMAVDEAVTRYHLENAEWPKTRMAGVIPPELIDYLRNDPFARGVPTGGDYRWISTPDGTEAALRIIDPDASLEDWMLIDELLDDGDLSTGRIVSKSQNRLDIYFSDYKSESAQTLDAQIQMPGP